jgi:hypothetical protein
VGRVGHELAALRRGLGGELRGGLGTGLSSWLLRRLAGRGFGRGLGNIFLLVTGVRGLLLVIRGIAIISTSRGFSILGVDVAGCSGLRGLRLAGIAVSGGVSGVTDMDGF